ncbi:tetratricopeptide repeat protein [Methylomonas sp. AM2-LC]|uniref:tetratricopeptide repeat protein n=1 Tax=Methylomonas sp. AM2-LC TaxID=3153301 RepID=UPI003264F7BA
MLDMHPRAQLCFILEQYGRVLINEPKRCRGMLKDLAPHHTRETNLLITALEQKIADELLKPNPLISVDMQIERLAKRLHDNLGTQLEFAYWAVESWALALNVIHQPLLKQNDMAEDAYRYEKSISQLKQTAKPGHIDAQNDLGILFLAAEQGDVKGQCNLGNMYLDGQGIAQNYQKAVEWYRKAAEQGDANGQNSLGFVYTNGYGVTQDNQKAVEWFRKAAEQGNAKGQYNLGVMYTNGYGVTQDNQKALDWYRKAAEQGFDAAKQALENLIVVSQTEASRPAKKKLTIPEDASLRRHFLTQLQVEIESQLGVPPTVPALKRHYDSEVKRKMDEYLAGCS